MIWAVTDSAAQEAAWAQAMAWFAEPGTRSAGFEALSRLWEEWPQRRQEIIDQVCGFLRTPYTPFDLDPTGTTPFNQVLERPEHQARLAAQRFLRQHLTFVPGEDPQEIFSIDLSGAFLTDFDLCNCRVSDARFTRAFFFGNALFQGVHVLGVADFSGAIFTGTAYFDFAHLKRSCFLKASFSGGSSFYQTEFVTPPEFTHGRIPDPWELDQPAPESRTPQRPVRPSNGHGSPVSMPSGTLTTGLMNAGLWVTTAMASGVVGNIAYDLIKASLPRLSRRRSRLRRFLLWRHDKKRPIKIYQDIAVRVVQERCRQLNLPAPKPNALRLEKVQCNEKGYIYYLRSKSLSARIEIPHGALDGAFIGVTLYTGQSPMTWQNH